MSSVCPASSSLVYSYPRTHSRFHLPQQRCYIGPRTSPCHLLPSMNLRSRRLTLRCCSSASPGGPGPGENESKTILDAFFLGKAIGEALSERVESTVGEFLSTIGRLQAEQQKQVQEFQEEVLDRAKKAKEKAARESMESQGLITPNTTTVNGTSFGTTSPNPPNVQDFNREPGPTDTDFLFGISNED
nr:uncharacterized protein At4g13200, chloroplastic [Ipomoea trifida]